MQRVVVIGSGLIFSGAAMLANAQINTDTNRDQAPAGATDPLNGYAEILKPTKSRAASGTRGAALANRPYEPIRRLDDEGQILEIEMFVGESRVFPTPGVARIAVGNGSLLTAAAIDNKEVIVFANGAGTSSLFIWNADGRYQRVKVSIVPGDTTRYAREIAAFLSGIPKAKASIVGANIIVEGDELSDTDLTKIDDLSKRYPQIVNFTNRVGWEQMILMDVKVVEFPISFLRDVGLRWTATGGAAIGAIWGPSRFGDGGPYQITVQTGANNAPPISGLDPSGNPSTNTILPSGLNARTVLNLGLNAQLNLLEQEGKATTLAEPQLSARNGSRASFTAGGEIPYSVQTRDGINVAFKEYGVKLDITPKVDRGGVIRALIHAEVSSIDGSVTTSSGPALLLRKTDTEFNLRAGETMVLSGLLQREKNATIDKVPLLGDIPILGELFRSKRYQNKETEMVVFVTPTLVSAKSPGNLDRVERLNERLQEELGPSPFLSAPVQPGVSNERPNAIPLRPMIPASAAGGELPGTGYLPVPIQPAPISAMPTPAAKASTRGSSLQMLSDAVLRAMPNHSGRPLLQLRRGATVQLGTANEQAVGSAVWRNVTLGSLTGWVPAKTVGLQRIDVPGPMLGTAAGVSSDIQIPRSSGSVASPGLVQALTLGQPGANAPMYRVAKGGLVLRLTPDVNAGVVARPAAGDLVVGLPYPTRGGWSAVQYGEGDGARRGWITSQWLLPLAR